MAQQTKAIFLAGLPVLLPDNTTRIIDPDRHRSVETNMADSVGWLTDNNQWSGSNAFGSYVRVKVVRMDALNAKIGTEYMHTIFGETPGTREVSRPSAANNYDPETGTGRIVILKNQSAVDVPVIGSVNDQFFTWQVVSSFTLVPGQMVTLISDGTYWNVS